MGIVYVVHSSLILRRSAKGMWPVEEVHSGYTHPLINVNDFYVSLRYCHCCTETTKRIVPCSLMQSNKAIKELLSIAENSRRKQGRFASGRSMYKTYTKAGKSIAKRYVGGALTGFIVIDYTIHASIVNNWQGIRQGNR